MASRRTTAPVFRLSNNSDRPNDSRVFWSVRFYRFGMKRLIVLVMFVIRSGVSAQVPETSFTCHGHPPGYYGDPQTGCKTYHVCDGHAHFTYICPRGTLFQQRTQICDHSYLVRCEDSPRFYPNEVSTENSAPETESKKFLKIRINDFRSLFFIPEFENNSIVAGPQREFFLPVDKPNVVRFKNQKQVSGSPCPAHCDPKFFLPQTCHPCIFIK